MDVAASEFYDAEKKKYDLDKWVKKDNDKGEGEKSGKIILLCSTRVEVSYSVQLLFQAI